MASDQVGADRQLPAALDDESRTDALDVLRDALEWRLTEARWGSVAAAVGALVAALRSGDVDAFREAVSDLELAGPVRATGFGDTPTVPAPAPVRDEINELIHTIDGRAAAQE
ncbi:MAG: CATRA system-associated protein [Pseudonocardia sp.]